MESSSSSYSPSSDSNFGIKLIYKGRSEIIEVSTATNGLWIHQQTLQVFGLADDDNEIELKILYKGKQITSDRGTCPFAGGISTSKNTSRSKLPKIMVIATNTSVVRELSTKRSDPTIRGFDQEKEVIEKRRKADVSQKPWAEGMVQDKEYKFCRMEACTWQSFGHRSTEKTPHAFHSIKLLEKLATDPGIVAIMKERELVVGTLGELDPIDDRVMKKKEESSGGGCVLGYNTNRGLRIDIKLRTDDLSGFRSYSELASTLIHELSHNWVGEHGLLFWTNFAQMRAEYLYVHARLRDSSLIVRGKTTAELAGLDRAKLDNVFDFIMYELVQEMGQHGLHPNMIEVPIRQRIRELDESRKNGGQGQRLGEATNKIDRTSTIVNNSIPAYSTRELLLAAAERRARLQQNKKG